MSDVPLWEARMGPQRCGATGGCREPLSQWWWGGGRWSMQVRWWSWHGTSGYKRLFRSEIKEPSLSRKSERGSCWPMAKGESNNSHLELKKSSKIYLQLRQVTANNLIIYKNRGTYARVSPWRENSLWVLPAADKKHALMWEVPAMHWHPIRGGHQPCISYYLP